MSCLYLDILMSNLTECVIYSYIFLSCGVVDYLLHLLPFPKFGTVAIHEGQDPDQWAHGEVVPPISMASTFKQNGPGDPKTYKYSPGGNPTRTSLEKCLAGLEGGKYGLVFSSGLGAVTAVMTLLSVGDHAIVGEDIFGGSHRLFSDIFSRHGIEYSFVDSTDLDVVETSVIQGKTKMIYIKTPTNPTMKIVDIKAICKIARKWKDILVVVDNTFMSPYFQRPLMWGADISLCSLTKYFNGHSDVVLGGISTNNEEIYEKMKFLQNATGIVPSPFDCFLANRGGKTLHVRMERHQKNALAIATFLENHVMVEKVYYPGLKSHPQHELVNKQCSGYSGMVSCVLKGSVDVAEAFIGAVKIFHLAESLGGITSSIKHPVLMSDGSLDAEHFRKMGITDTFLRFSIGLEDVDDLIADLNQALKVASIVRP